MRKGLAIGLILALAATIGRADAATVRVVHRAPLQCSVACAHWDVPSALGYDECRVPFPEGSRDQSLFAFTSTVVGAAIDIYARPDVDYDTFACTNSQPSLLVASLANTIPGECDSSTTGVNTPVPTVGCIEVGTVTWSSIVATLGFAPVDRSFIVRSYNSADFGTNRIDLTGPVALLDDRYRARCPLGLGYLAGCSPR